MEKTEKKLPLVVIFGRANVGKSTLFNCLIEKKQAITSDVPGTTRDSNLNIVHWDKSVFQLVDTGGILNPTQEIMFKKEAGAKEAKNISDIDIKVQKQAVNFLKLADLVLFVVDNKTGLLAQDRQMVSVLRKNLSHEEQKKIILVVNKVDSQRQGADAMAFKKLGLGEPHLVSAATGTGTGDLLDFTAKLLKKKKLTKKDEGEKDEKEMIKVCILGKPNVGKSSLLNALLGYEKVIVSPIPHTTREPQNTEIDYNGRHIALIDTAGISKHGHKGEGLEIYGIQKTLGTLRRADIVLLVVDIHEGLTHQETKLADEIINEGKSLIIVANKWDLVETKDTKKYTEEIYYSLPFANWAPIQFVSAKTTLKVQKIFDLILEMDAARKRQISDSQLSHFLSKIVKIHLPAKDTGTKPPRIYEITQTKTDPPRFLVRIGAMDSLHFSYVRFIKNQLRAQFKLVGVPIKIDVKNNPLVHGKKDLEARPGRKRPIAGRPAPAPKGYKPGRR